jgi:GH15 family glucan-1,4-alpha-glucosidase
VEVGLVNATSPLAALARRSVAVIRANQAPSGAYLASPNFPVYRYSWFRDGAFIADAMSRAGDGASAEAFFRWCAAVVEARAAKIGSLIDRHRAGQAIGPDEFLHARYTVEGEEVSHEWWNFQLDGYGTWLWALAAHARRTKAVNLDTYRTAIALSVRYLVEFWNEPSYDWWEEHVGQRHTSTLAALYAGFVEARQWEQLPADLREQAGRTAEAIRQTVLARGRQDGHLVKWLGGDALDASLVACGVPFGLLKPDDPIMTATIAAIESRLAHGGVHRYLDDTYYGGGEWPLLSALLGWHYATVGRVKDAHAQLDWIVKHATAERDLPEQVPDHLLAPGARQAWIDRWGPVATPLLWSHAMFLTLALELGALTAPITVAE